MHEPSEHTRLASVHAPPAQHGSPFAPQGAAVPLEEPEPEPDPELDPAPELDPEPVLASEPELDPELDRDGDAPEHAGASAARPRANATRPTATSRGMTSDGYASGHATFPATSVRDAHRLLRCPLVKPATSLRAASFWFAWARARAAS